MQIFFYNIIFILSVSSVFAQTDSTKKPPLPTKQNTVKNELYEKIDENDKVAEFPGGNIAFKKFVTSISQKIADSTRQNKIKSGTFTIEVNFLIGLDGNVTEVNAKCSPKNTFIQNCIISAFRQSPQWRPGILYGKPVKTFKTQQIKIEI